MSNARDGVTLMAQACDWTVKASEIDPDNTTRMARGLETIVVHWFPGGAMKSATRYSSDGGPVEETLHRQDKDRRRKLEAWVQAAPTGALA